jgi:acyl-CoA synthetase (AMP-forming)/AMP-acid ligase II
VVINPDHQQTTTLISCGQLIDGHQLLIVDPKNNQVLNDRQVGEVWLKGPSVARGYWRKPDLNKQNFNARPAGDQHQAGWLRTGDLGFMLYITGRHKDLIILRGRNLYPQDLEITATATSDYLATDGCAAFSVDNGVDNNHQTQLILVLEVTRQGFRKLDTTQAKKTVTRAVSQPHGVIVSDIIFIKPATLSRTSSGKIQRSATAKQYLNGDLPSIISQHVNTVKTLSYQCLATLLEQQPGANKNVISRHTAFADLALDSLGAVQLTEQLNQQLGRTVEPMLIWDHPHGR